MKFINKYPEKKVTSITIPRNDGCGYWGHHNAHPEVTPINAIALEVEERNAGIIKDGEEIDDYVLYKGN